jgi:hypothetical protein
MNNFLLNEGYDDLNNLFTSGKGSNIYIDNKKRFFIYGSYVLSKPVIWKYKNLTYIHRIKKTNKQLLTSRHNTDYITNNVIQ